MTDVNYTPEFDPVDVDGDYGSTGGDITVPTFHDIKPFRFWCQKALPLVYDDSLSYYEVLCKVVNYLNNMMTNLTTGTGAITQFANQFVINQQFLNDMATKLGQNTEELEDYINDRMDDFTTAYNELQDYVNQYFNNLDVQDEIDTKLDEMAESGQFNVLFDPVIQTWMEEETEYINTSVANQNSTLAQQNGRISTLEGRMDTFASLPSGSTSGNAELLDIRTNFLGETFASAGDAVRYSDMLAGGFKSLPFNVYDGDVSGSGVTTKTISIDTQDYRGLANLIAIVNTNEISSPVAGKEIDLEHFGNFLYGSNNVVPSDDNSHLISYYDDLGLIINHAYTIAVDGSYSRALLSFSIPQNYQYRYLQIECYYDEDAPTQALPMPPYIVYGSLWSKTAVDPTLSLTGEAADAKATGDALRELNERFENQSKTPFSNENYQSLAVSGKAVNFGSLSVGSDVPQPYNTNNFRTLYVSCAEGDVFSIKAVATAGVGLWCFVDASRKLLLRSTNNDYDASTPVEITAPTNATGLIINFSETTYTGSYVVKLGSKFRYYDTIESMTKDYTDTEINKLAYYTEADVNKPGLWEQGHIKIADGTDGASSAASFKMSIRTNGYLDARIQSLMILTFCAVRVFRYTQSDVFVDSTNYWGEQRIALPVNYKYRLMIQHENGPDITVSDAWFDVSFQSYEDAYARNVTSGNLALLGGYYQGLGQEYNLFERTALTSQIYAKYSEIIASDTCNYASMTKIGTASDSQDLYKVTLKPMQVSLSGVSPLPKIIIVAGQHGSEKSSVIGTLYFVRDLVQNWNKNSVLEYLHDNAEIIILPVANPYGFDHIEYKNANGVNLNRNYDYNFTPGDDPTAQSYGGLVPFDQPETQAIRDLVIANRDALMVIDYHVNTGGVAVSYPAINWLNLSKIDTYNRYLFKMVEAAYTHVSSITNHFITDYNLNTNGALCGTVTTGLNDTDGGVSSLKNWAESVIIPALTFEGFDGFPGTTSFTPEAEKACSELIGNWVVRAIYSMLN